MMPMRAILLLVLLAAAVQAAALSGAIYAYDTLENVNDTIVKFQGQNAYQVISANGTYSLEIAPGAYNVTAVHFENGTLAYYTKERLVVGEGSQKFDLVLFEPDWFDSTELPKFEGLELPAPAIAPQAAPPWWRVALGLLVLVAIAVVIILALVVRKYTNFGRAPAEKKELDQDGIKTLKIIKDNEGRMEQKQLRAILDFSESKMSLLLTELEVSGHIKRFKKGRENIIKLKKEA